MTDPLYLLDTNICIYIINRKPERVFQHLRGLRAGQVALSSVSGAELAFGVTKTGSRRNRDALEKFLAPLDILPFDETAMGRYGELRAHLERAGTPIGPMDTLIAAQALALGATLVTNNQREFQRVPDLFLENWAA